MLKKNFTRKELTNKIYQNLGFSKNMSSSLIDDFFESIILELINLKKIKISSFGTFEIVHKNERIGRNPKTKKEARITARKIVKFKPSVQFKEKINKNDN
tara:strand:- start:3262 stop:3561 length:300 start_codon:yes stop_codon:yes gene_type:complete